MEVVARHKGRVLDVHHVGLGVERYRVGEDSACECTVTVPGRAEVVLVRREDDGFTVALDHGRVALEAGARFVVQLGEVEFAIHEQPYEPQVLQRRPIDRRFWSYNAGSAAVLGGLVVFLSNVPVRASPPNQTATPLEVANVAFSGAPPLASERLPTVDTDPERPSSEPRLGPQRSRGRDLLAIEDPDAPYQPPAMTLNFDPDMASLLAARSGLVQRSGHFLASPYDGAFALGNEDEDVWTALVDGTADGRERAQRGLRGPDRRHRVRVGSIRLPNGPLPGNGTGNLMAHVHLPKLQACYDEARLHDPDLKGRLSVDFKVGRRSRSFRRRVSRGIPAVRDCVARAVRGWRLPPAANPDLDHYFASYEFIFGE